MWRNKHSLDFFLFLSHFKFWLKFSLPYSSQSIPATFLLHQIHFSSISLQERAVLPGI